MAKKAKKAAPVLTLVLRSGAEMAITGEDGRYWYCGETRFRKTNADILTVETAAEKGDALDAENVENAENAEESAEEQGL